MKKQLAFFSVFMMLALLISLLFQVTPASAAGETFDLTVSETYNYASSGTALNVATGLPADRQ